MQEDRIKRINELYHLSKERPLTEEELKELITKLEDLGEYKECSRYIHLCHNKIEELKNKEEEAFAAQDVETTLIAAKAYLSSGNEDLATQNFEKVLSMGSGTLSRGGNPHSHGIDRVLFPAVGRMDRRTSS